MRKWLGVLAAALLFAWGTNALAGERILPPEEIPLAETEAQILAELRLFFGTDQGMELERMVTRAEAVVMAGRMEASSVRKPVSVSEAAIGRVISPYNDLPDNHWALGMIQYAAARNIVVGTGNGNFEPNRFVTGKEFTVMLLKALGYADVSTDTVYGIGVECGLLADNFTKSVVKEDRALSRSDAVRLCYGALLAKNYSQQLVKDVLIANRIFTEAEFNRAVLCQGVEVQKTFAEKMNSVMPAGQNYMFSPLSVKMALAMAVNGASESVKAEILELLDIADLEQFNQDAKACIEKYEKQTAIELNITNSIWLNEDVALLKKNAVFDPLFEEIIRDCYFGAVRRTDNKKAVEEVNAWTKEKTKGKIDKIISDADFTALLANAVYFKADWAEQFDPQFTRPAMFHNYDGTATETEFMHDTRYVQYYRQNGIEMVRLPYRNANIAMYFMLTPTEQPNFENIIRNAYMENKKVILSIPKFESDFFIDLTEPIKSLGVRQAFGDADPFPKMVVGEPLKIDKILHKTYIKAEETGTEAAAVTVIGMVEATAVTDYERIYFTADRPFTYVIRDEESKEILFAGRYVSAN